MLVQHALLHFTASQLESVSVSTQQQQQQQQQHTQASLLPSATQSHTTLPSHSTDICQARQTLMASLEQWLRDFPPVTRVWIAGAVLTTAACSLDLLSPFTLYFNAPLIAKGQVWRLITPYLYFSSSFNLDYLFHLYFLCRYCKALEDSYAFSASAGRTVHFFYMLLLGATAINMIAPLAGLYFTGSSLTFMLVYVWSRRNPATRMNFLGVFTFTAPYLPYVLLGFGVMLGHEAINDIIGILVGHLYFFLTDVYPRLTSPPLRLLATPRWLELLWQGGSARQNRDTAAFPEVVNLDD